MSGPSTSEADRSSPIFQHAFLQAVMQRGFMSESDSKELYKRIMKTTETGNYIATISAINQNISFAKFELRRGKWPGNNEAYIGFVNTEADEASKRATRFKTKDGKPDIRYAAFFKALVEGIAAHPGSAAVPLGWVDTTQALNIPINLTPAAPAAAGSADGAGPSTAPVAQAAVQPFRLADREAALAAFVADGWLAFTQGQPSAYSLGPRAFLELGPMLAEMDMQPVPKAALVSALGL